jgi:predicted DCC family thiol-disulfide oxidoreductase YuxK
MYPPFGTGWLVGILPMDEGLVRLCCLLFKITCWMSLLGIFSRFSIPAAALLFYYLGGIPQLFGKVDHYHNLLWFNTILAFSPCADYLSIDAILKACRRADTGVVTPPQPSRAYGLPIRLIWLLMGIAYFGPGFWKIWNNGVAWICGDNLKLHMYYKWMDFDGWMPAFRLDQYPVLCHLGGLFAILFESSFIFLIFIPAWRWLVVVGGVVFHTFTDVFMRISFWDLKFFYFVFFPLERIFKRMGAWLFPEEMTVFFDGNCELCRRTAASLRVFDLFSRIRYLNALAPDSLKELKQSGIDEQTALKDMCAVAAGKIYKGYDAYRMIAFRIPFLWPVLPFLFIWPVTSIGPAVYRRIADSRSCQIPQAPRGAIHERTSPSKALIIAGTILVAGNLYCALRDIGSGWPFAGYPTFSNLAFDRFGALEIETINADGKSALLSQEVLAGRESPERLTGLISKILYKDRPGRERRFKALWTLLAKKHPGLSSVKSVKFYEVLKTTIPAEKYRNPLSRNLIYELKLD